MECPEVARVNTDIMLALGHRDTQNPIFNLTPQRIAELAGEFGDRIKAFPTDLCPKDPRFTITFPVWWNVRHDIEFVIVCLRDLHDVVKSAQGTHTLLLHEPDDSQLAFSQVAARQGYLLNYLLVHAVPRFFLRFPHVVQTPGEIFAHLRPIVHEHGLRKISDVWNQLARPDLVHFPPRGPHA